MFILRCREHVHYKIDLEDLKKDTGFTTLVEFLDKHLAKDDLADSLEKFEDFEDFTRPKGQSIHEYVANFDSKYRKIEKKNIKLPSEILAFKLLRKANITKEEKMLVLTRMNYENKLILYEEAKRSLKKFKGEGGRVKDISQSIKIEPTFLAENEEALWAAGYAKRGNSYSYKRGGDIVELGNDARNCAVLDSACSSTVCGKTWLNSYISSLNEEDREKVVNHSGHKVFNFGGGTRLKSVGESWSAMKKTGVKMDLENDTAIIMGKEVSLNLTSSGHYCIPIDKTETLKVDEVNAVRVDELSVEKRISALLKLYRQFAHPPKKRLVALLKDAGIWKEQYDEDLSEIQSNCELCKMYDVTPPRPVVSMPMAKQFNEKVTVYLKQYKDRWILHMTDMWSRHGGVFVRVSPNRLCKINDNLGENTEQDKIALKNCDTIIGKKFKEPNIAQKKSLDIIAETIISTQEGLSHEATAVKDQINDIEVHTTDEVDQTGNDIAKQLELKKLKQFDTYEEVEDGGQKTISTRWVITNKNEDTRARLVAQGFEEQSFIPKDSHTIGKGSFRLFLTFAASKKWTIKTTDIKSEFLQENKLECDVHIKPPVESDTPKGFIWKLKHGLYGLKDGARQFYINVKDELLNLGCRHSKLDPVKFILTVKGSVLGIYCCHVDDVLHAGNEEFEKLMEKLRKRFIAGKIEEEDFLYIGFMIKENNEDHQPIEPQRAFQKLKQLTQEEQTDYRRMVGQLNWAVQGSRPDLAFELVDLSTKLKSALVCDLLRAVKNIGKKYRSSYIVWIKDRIGKCCPISWQANKIKRVVRSTIAAEALSLQDGLETALYFRKIIEDICGVGERIIPITAFIDNKSVPEALKSTKLVVEKRLRIDIAAICEMIQNNYVEVKWCPGKVQLANSMTKRGASGIELLNVLQKEQMPEGFV
ncbi:unnamed protein product [Mytilus coruscus]|uniref:Reverse transcriptase Ty1/copia-type domain-containing protein n=1 Tax=Mytilus coruscus TaxID=42192 RepID=A0A6J8AQL8_MYTCO|nr:unnamed protein product [Mytilus coruscus]